MTNCRFVASDQPRVLAGRHLDPCVCDGEIGCMICPDYHCIVCGRAHAKVTCTGCLDAARSDLKAIGDLCASLPAEAVEKGVQSEAMMLLGPSSDPEAWRNRATSAMVGRLDASYLEDCRDEMHPLWILGTWEQIWRDHLDHYSIAPVTVASAHAYLDMQIGYMSEQIEPAFDEFARELRGCRAHLEDVLRDGIREERGAPCVQCEKPMIRVADHWVCRRCDRWVTEDQYRYAVGVAYLQHSDKLTAADMYERTGVKPSVVRVWGSRDQSIKRGKNHLGITLYDVASVIAKRDKEETEQAG
jgi:hypothetical protein